MEQDCEGFESFEDVKMVGRPENGGYGRKPLVLFLKLSLVRFPRSSMRPIRGDVLDWRSGVCTLIESASRSTEAFLHTTS